MGILTKSPKITEKMYEEDRRVEKVALLNL